MIRRSVIAKTWKRVRTYCPHCEIYLKTSKKVCPACGGKTKYEVNPHA